MTIRVFGYCCVFLLVSTPAWGINFDVLLDPSQSVPAPTLNGATPSGSAVVSVDTLTGDVNVTGTYTGLTSNAAAAHIHGLAASGSTAGVLVGLNVDAATSGSLTGGGTLTADGLTGLLAGQTYINLHTGNNGSGEIRGQIVDTDIKLFELTLDPGQAVPTPNLGGATPSGDATVVVDMSTGEIEVSGSYTGMTSDVSAAHLHGLADVGQTAGVLVGFAVSGGTDGTFTGSGTLAPDHLAGLLAGQSYINVHTGTNGPGEIRAQVVPEPSAFVLLFLGMLPLARLR